MSPTTIKQGFEKQDKEVDVEKEYGFRVNVTKTKYYLVRASSLDHANIKLDEYFNDRKKSHDDFDWIEVDKAGRSYTDSNEVREIEPLDP
tara:strand:+ start:170 stop:439 length:270 start_codon:yes stop_codon:yes gene_type:complete